MGAIAPSTRIGVVRLDVADVERERSFYERVLGLHTLDGSDDVVALGAGAAPLVELAARPDAPPRPPGTTGLFHLAVLVPGRGDLAVALRRVAQTGWPLSGASDHLVSEALYTGDVERNGIEIYRDRPREEWTYRGGELQMDTLPLDVEDLLAQDGGQDDRGDGMPEGTTIGHVHLQVADLKAAEAFYVDVLGFEVTVRTYPGALFIAAGGYHHHIGLNTWATAGAPLAPAGSLGLAWFEVLVPDAAELERIEQRLRSAEAQVAREAGGLLATDPSGNRVLLRAA